MRKTLTLIGLLSLISATLAATDEAFLQAYQQGVKDLDAKNYQQAIEDFTKASGLTDRNEYKGPAYFRIGEACEKAGKPAEAAKAYLQATHYPIPRRDPENPQAHRHIREAYDRLQKLYARNPVELRKVYQKLLQYKSMRSNQRTDLWLKIMKTYATEKNAKEVDACVTQLSADTGSGFARYRLLREVADAYKRCDKPERALAYYQKILDAPGMDSNWLDDTHKNMGEIHQRLKQFEQAEKHYKAVVDNKQCQPNRKVDVSFRLASVYKQQQELEKAIQVLESAKALSINKKTGNKLDNEIAKLKKQKK